MPIASICSYNEHTKTEKPIASAKTYAATLRARVDSTTKKKAAWVLEKMGINVSEAGEGCRRKFRCVPKKEISCILA